MVMIGGFQAGQKQAVPQSVLSSNAVAPDRNRVYEVELTLAQAMSPSQEMAAATTVFNEYKPPGVEILGVEAKGDKIRLQFVQSTALPLGAEAIFPWAEFLGGLGTILAAIVPLIIIVMVWLVLSQISGALWSIILVGGLFIGGLVLFTQAKTPGASRGRTEIHGGKGGWGLTLA